MTRICLSPLCPNVLVQRENESPSRFKKRRHCNVKCSHDALSEKNRKRKKPERRAECDKCHETFVQKRWSQKVCPTCRAASRPARPSPKGSLPISPVDILFMLSHRGRLEIETELMPHIRASLGL